MLDLAKEGLVDTVPNKGFRVTAVTEKQLDEYTQVRSLVEIPTTVGLARTADPVSLEALRPAAREIVAAAAAGDLIAYVEADTRFHLGLLALAGNAHLVEVVGDLRKRSRLYGLTALAESGRAAVLGAGAPGTPGRPPRPRRGRRTRGDDPPPRSCARNVGRARLIVDAAHASGATGASLTGVIGATRAPPDVESMIGQCLT